MENNSDEQKRMILAVVISTVIFMGWQYFFPPAPVKTSAVQNSSSFSTTNDNKNTSEQSAHDFSHDRIQSSKTGADKLSHQNEIIKERSTLSAIGDKDFTFDQAFTLLNIEDPSINQPFNDIAGLQGGIEIELISGSKKYSPNFTWVAKDASGWKGVDQRLGVTLDLTVMENGDLHFNYSSTNPFVFQLKINSTPKEKKTEEIKESLYFTIKKVWKEKLLVMNLVVSLL